MDPLFFTYTINGLVMIILPFVLAAYLTKRINVGWRLVFIGAAGFVFSQIGHIPFNLFLTQLFAQGVLPSPPQAYQLIFNAIVLGLSAGLWEEITRYATFRWFAKEARSWGSALVLGSGWGGVESLIIGVLFALTFIQMIALRNADLTNFVPADQLDLVETQVTFFWSQPIIASILGALERIFAICFHLSASVLVLQVFRKRQIRWLIFAILWHTLFNAIAVFSVQTWGAYVTEVLLGVFALASIAVVFAMRENNTEIPVSGSEDLAPVLDANSLEQVDESDISDEQIKDSRYG